MRQRRGMWGRTWALVALLACLGGVPISGWALGMGELTVESFLNQPFKARIDLLARPDEDLTSVSAGLAPAADFALVGASREALAVPLRFRVESDGPEAVIRISSDLPVKDPVVRLVVEVLWANGRLLREYTVFLDPPTVPSAAPPPVTREATAPAPAAPPPARPIAPPVAEREPPPVDQPEAVDQPDAAVAEAPAPAPEPEPVTPPPLYGTDDIGPVRAGQTLWSIANDWSQGSGYTTNQVMLAIQQRNPNAFIGDNINRLKQGAILRMPERNEITALSAAEATAEVIAQEEAYELTRLGLASAPPTVSDAGASGADRLPPPPLDETPSTASAGRLELIPPAEAEEGTGDDERAADPDAAVGPSTEERLARYEEDLANAEQEKEYLADRVEALEAELEAAREQAATVADDTLAEMEQRLRDERLAEREVAPEPVESEERSWYVNPLPWILLGLAVIVVAVVLARRRTRDYAAAGGVADSVAGRDPEVESIQAEAEDILRTLDPAGSPPEDEPDDETVVAPPNVDDDTEVVPVSETDDGDGDMRERRAHDDDGIVAEELTADDPEVKLDLARAYLAMGDKEAARVMLDEVLEVGGEDQRSEARSMLDEL